MDAATSRRASAHAHSSGSIQRAVLHGEFSPRPSPPYKNLANRAYLLITLGKLMSGCSKNPTNTSQNRPENRKRLLNFHETLTKTRQMVSLRPASAVC